MLPHEPEAVVGCAMGDAVGDDEEIFSNSRPGQGEEDDEMAIPETREDAISVISEANSIKSSKSKKRVQFLPDGMLVRVREIPPRSNKSSSESDGSASESGSDSSDDSDSDSGDTDSEDPSNSDRDTPPPEKTVSETKFTTMPPLVWNPATAKGSYNVTKQSMAKQGSLVAKITGIHRAPSPSSTPKATPKRTRRTPSPKLDKRPKRGGKHNEKGGGGKVSPDTAKRPKAPKKQIATKKEGKTSPPPQPKPSKNPPLATRNPSNSKMTLAQRRASSAPPSKLSAAKRNHTPTISTSVTVLPTAPQAHMDTSVDRVTRAMQSLTVGQLYTVDGFIFPSHHVPDLHLPDVLQVNGRRGSSDSLPSPRKSIDFTGPASGDHNHYHQSQQQTPMHQPLSPQSANRKRRYYAWQMANGSIQNTLQNTPSIAQLWDNVHQASSKDTSTGASSSTTKALSSGHRKS